MLSLNDLIVGDLYMVLQRDDGDDMVLLKPGEHDTGPDPDGIPRVHHMEMEYLGLGDYHGTDVAVFREGPPTAGRYITADEEEAEELNYCNVWPREDIGKDIEVWPLGGDV